MLSGFIHCEKRPVCSQLVQEQSSAAGASGRAVPSALTPPPPQFKPPQNRSKRGEHLPCALTTSTVKSTPKFPVATIIHRRSLFLSYVPSAIQILSACLALPCLLCITTLFLHSPSTHQFRATKHTSLTTRMPVGMEHRAPRATG